MRFDISYADRMSLGKDLKILLKTGPAIIGMVLEAMFKKIAKKIPALPEEYVGSGRAEGESVHNA